MKPYLVAPLALVAFSPAHAAGLFDLQKIAASVDGEYLSYSGAYGSRRVVNAQTKMDLGDTEIQLGLSQGARKAGDERFKAMRASAAIVHNWSSRISTRTSASISSNQPVFVNRELSQEISYKPMRQTVLTAGARYARYWGGVDAVSWSLGAAQYFRGGMVSYRFSAYNVHGLGNSTGHLVNVKVDDPYGSNQLWLGHGTSLHDAAWLGLPEKGKFNSVEYRRVQPIGGGVGLMVGVNRSWYEADNAKFRGTGARIGLTFSR